MKTIIAASALSLAAFFSAATASQAASVIVTTDTRPAMRHHVDERHYVRPRHHACHVEKVKSYRHGKVFIKETKICR